MIQGDDGKESGSVSETILKDNLRAKIPAWFFSCRVLHKKVTEIKFTLSCFF